MSALCTLTLSFYAFIHLLWGMLGFRSGREVSRTKGSGTKVGEWPAFTITVSEGSGTGLEWFMKGWDLVGGHMTTGIPDSPSSALGKERKVHAVESRAPTSVWVQVWGARARSSLNEWWFCLGYHLQHWEWTGLLQRGQQNCWVREWLLFAGCMNARATPQALWILHPGMCG